MKCFNYDKLRGRMQEKRYNIKTLAAKIHVSPNTMSNKLYSITFFTTAEIADICDALDIAREEIPLYFFDC